MEDRPSAKHRSILHLDMPGQQDIVRHHDTIRDPGIMPHVDADHEEVVVADARGSRLLGGAVDGGVFANHVVIPDLDIGGGPRLEREILGISSDDRPITNNVAGTHPDMTGDHGTCLDPTSLSDHCA